jgi:CubicO group peptidase (beta-lactamase class C family)
MNDFSGAVLITRGNQVLLSHASGVADQKRGTLVTPATRFRIGSLTKQFTAMAILILEHRGRLRIGDRICHYLADCPAAWAPITLGQLLTHSSGIPDFMALTSYPVLSRHPSTPEHTLGLVRNLPLRFVPGSAYEYSNSGYVLLGMVVERASAMTYGAFLQKNIFGPLRMRDTGYDDGHQGVAVGYSSGSTPADPIDMSVLFSAAALYSTVGDLHRWEQSLSAGSLVPTSVVAEMEQPRVKRGNSVADQYGYGVHIDETGDANHPQVRIYHEGRVNGFVSWLSHYPESGIDIAILSNHDDTALTGVDFDDQVRRLILGS